MPLETIASAGWQSGGSGGAGLDPLAAALRALPLPVIGRIEDGALDARSALSGRRGRFVGQSARRWRNGAMIVGTAGHVDHGKTALVRALTGVDPDRLKEEKARGITIDLGFAYMPVADGAVIGFVDVPGHEHFVHNMLAGAAGIDFALLVVAADDGIMPQTLRASCHPRPARPRCAALSR